MVELDNNTRLGVERTRLAYERTMMAWIRTGISLITFGFSIYKFFQVEVDITKSTPRHAGLFGSANFALLMIATGLLALLLAALENRRCLQTLRADYPSIHFSRSLSGIFAGLVSILGIMAFIAVLFRT